MTKTIAQLSVTRLNDEGQKVIDKLCEQITKARLDQHLSQRELSDRIRRSHSYITKVENGELIPGILEMLSIAIVLDKPLKYFLPDYVKANDEKLDGQEWELVNSFREIQSEDLQELAIKQVKQLAEMKPKAKNR